VARAGIVHTIPPTPITATAPDPDSHAQAPLDINNDGVAEFTIHAYQATGFPWSSFGTYIRADRPGAYFQWEEVLEPLPAGSMIGPPDDYNFSGRLPFFEWVGIAGDGAWTFNDPPVFFGFRFDVDGASHFGWARAQITASTTPRSFSVTVFDYAYESVPGVPIVAGQIPGPGAAVLLSLASVTAFRRRRA